VDITLHVARGLSIEHSSSYIKDPCSRAQTDQVPPMTVNTARNIRAHI